MNPSKIFEPIFPNKVGFPFIEIELSTVCVSKCFACPRTSNLPEDKGWNVGYLDPESLLAFLRTADGLQQIVFCGAYGDPIYHPRFIEIIERLNQEIPRLRVFTETNGSHRPEDWWRKLASVSSTKNTYSFSLDGLEDTNKLYRIGTDWNSIVKGVETLRKHHRGPMQWKWILFKYNEHQLVQGYERSVQLGFNNFKLINSVRHNEESRPSMDFNEALNSLLSKKGASKMLQP